MVIWKLPIGMRLIFPFFGRWFPGSNVPSVSYRQLASMCVLYWKYGNSPYWWTWSLICFGAHFHAQ
ncbi:MAG: hypothetical protein AB7G75_19830 [Candidatus Binatia bacterium]